LKKPAGKAIGTGVLTDGKVAWTAPISFTHDLKALGNGPIVATVKLATAAAVRSEKANAYYWGCVLAEMATATGHSADEIHDAMCERFLPNESKRVEFFNKQTGEVLTVDVDHRRSSKLTGKAFYEFVEQVRQFAAEFLDVQTEDPNPEYWRRAA
jgi:hypothetical protein